MRQPPWLVKIRDDGTLVWQQSVQGSKGDVFNNLLSVGKDGYMLVGTSNSFRDGYQDGLLVRLNKYGKYGACDSVSPTDMILKDAAVQSVQTGASPVTLQNVSSDGSPGLTLSDYGNSAVETEICAPPF